MCDVVLEVIEHRWDELLDRAGDDFDGTSSSAWTAAETADFARLGVLFGVLGDHGSSDDPCLCSTVEATTRAEQTHGAHSAMHLPDACQQSGCARQAETYCPLCRTYLCLEHDELTPARKHDCLGGRADADGDTPV
jgi:hypothetical protein